MYQRPVFGTRQTSRRIVSKDSYPSMLGKRLSRQMQTQLHSCSILPPYMGSARTCLISQVFWHYMLNNGTAWLCISMQSKWSIICSTTGNVRILSWLACCEVASYTHTPDVRSMRVCGHGWRVSYSLVRSRVGNVRGPMPRSGVCSMHIEVAIFGGVAARFIAGQRYYL